MHHDATKNLFPEALATVAVLGTQAGRYALLEPPDNRQYTPEGVLLFLKEKLRLQPAPLSCEEGGRGGPQRVSSPGLTPASFMKVQLDLCAAFKVQLDLGVHLSPFPCL